MPKSTPRKGRLGLCGVFQHPLIHTISAPVFSLTEKICRKYDGLICDLLRTLFPNRDSYPNVHIMRDQLLILQQYAAAPVKDSFQDRHPRLAGDWHPVKNSALAPNMFRPNVPFKFYWRCRSCKRTYRMSMANRTKVNPDACPFCSRKSRYRSPLLCETYPDLGPLWSVPLNPVPFSQVSVASEKPAVFELTDGRIAAVRICNLSAWLYAHPGRRAEDYLERHWEKAVRLPAAAT